MLVTSPVFGTLAMLYAEDGVQVSKGEPIAQIESMKVFFEILAPCDGTVKWRYELGEVVSEGEHVGDVL